MTAETPQHEHLPQTVSIVGVGLIGGSIAAALRKRNLCSKIIGVGRNAEKLAPAVTRGLIDTIETDVATVSAVSDLVIFCTPVDRIVSAVRAAAQTSREGTLLTDVGSVKSGICRELEGTLANGVTFIGSHPLAGSEKSGFEHADPDLFIGRVCVMTPVADSSLNQRNRLTAFWQSLGMNVIHKSPDEHDRLLAVTSHVPHLIAGALASLLDSETSPFAATGFRDTTRIAASDPELWSAIVQANTEAIQQGLDRFAAVLQEFRDAIAAGDRSLLKKLLQTAKTKREALDAESFGTLGSR